LAVGISRGLFAHWERLTKEWWSQRRHHRRMRERWHHKGPRRKHHSTKLRLWGCWRTALFCILINSGTCFLERLGGKPNHPCHSSVVEPEQWEKNPPTRPTKEKKATHARRGKNNNGTFIICWRMMSVRPVRRVIFSIEAFVTVGFWELLKRGESTKHKTNVFLFLFYFSSWLAHCPSLHCTSLPFTFCSIIHNVSPVLWEVHSSLPPLHWFFKVSKGGWWVCRYSQRPGCLSVCSQIDLLVGGLESSIQAPRRSHQWEQINKRLYGKRGGNRSCQNIFQTGVQT